MLLKSLEMWQNLLWHSSFATRSNDKNDKAETTGESSEVIKGSRDEVIETERGNPIFGRGDDGDYVDALKEF
ncbi:unnamed protein product [Allacma fusca]|uniref:Uncharacterized protein n=1 Tax=Allacma fusca TaxID=39272 RepID=A0A8J2P7U3_9HEXA|nr:unnamed protein product [Allacma fusca]